MPGGTAVGGGVHPVEEAADPAHLLIEEADALHTAAGIRLLARHHDLHRPLLATINRLAHTVCPVGGCQRDVDDVFAHGVDLPRPSGAVVANEHRSPGQAAVGGLVDDRRTGG